jgi:parvulin-like peptidyl-prolyl isomerase
MKLTPWVILALAALAAAGCGDGQARMGLNWPSARDGDVPITNPSSDEGNPAVGAAKTAVALRPAEIPGAQPRYTTAKPIVQPTDLESLLSGTRTGSSVLSTADANAGGLTGAAAGGPGGAGPVDPNAKPPPAVAAARPVEPDEFPTGDAKVLGQPQVVASSVLQVNNRFITAEDVLKRLVTRVRALPRTASEDAFRRAVGAIAAEEIRGQVSRVLVLAEAEKKLPDEAKKKVDGEVENQLRDMITEAGGSKSLLKEKLAKEGVSLDDVMTEIRQREMSSLYLRSRFMPAIVVSRQMLWDHYRANRKDHEQDKKVQMQIIAAPVRAFLPADVARPNGAEEAAAKDAARKHIEAAQAALAKGEEFGAVATRMSKDIKAAEGGLWPLMAAGSFREARVEEAAFGLIEGQTAGPIETESGYYIVKAKRVVGGRLVPFEEAQEEITHTLRNEQYRKLTDDYYHELIGGATVNHNAEFVELVIEQAVARWWKK